MYALRRLDSLVNGDHVADYKINIKSSFFPRARVAMSGKLRCALRQRAPRPREIADCFPARRRASSVDAIGIASPGFAVSEERSRLFQHWSLEPLLGMRPSQGVRFTALAFRSCTVYV